jgi:hypothetical protein
MLAFGARAEAAKLASGTNAPAMLTSRAGTVEPGWLFARERGLT